MILGVLLFAQITIGEYAARRAALADSLPPDGVAVVQGAPEPTEDYESFQQDPSFLYLTGVNEPDAALLMTKHGPGILFISGRDPSQEVWSGERMGLIGASRRTGLPARLRVELDSVLDSLRTHENLTVVETNHVLQELRGKKSPAELELLTRAALITSDGERAAFAMVAPGVNEYQVQATIEYTFRNEGADRPSFASTIGSGPNTTVLHYNTDHRVMRSGELVVMDVGAQYRGYAGDVTRTVPVNGHYSRAQRDIYDIVRGAQAAAERQAQIDAPARRMSDSATAVLAAGLARLGLIESDTATYECGNDRHCAQWSLYYMHLLGHGIGLEVHDPDQFYFTGKVAPGSAFTIEPGLYVRSNLDEIVPDTPRNRIMLGKIAAAIHRYANMGVRIEDDYIATPAGVRRISNAPREIDEIEAAMKRRRCLSGCPPAPVSPSPSPPDRP